MLSLYDMFCYNLPEDQTSTLAPTSSQGLGTIPQESHEQVPARHVANKGKTPATRFKLPVKRKAVVPEGIGLYVDTETGASVWKSSLKKRKPNSAEGSTSVSSTVVQVAASKHQKATVKSCTTHSQTRDKKQAKRCRKTCNKGNVNTKKEMDVNDLVTFYVMVVYLVFWKMFMYF